MINALFTTDHWGGLGLAGQLPWPDQTDYTDYAQQLTQNDVVVLGAKARLNSKIYGVFYKSTVYVATHETSAYARTISGDLRSELSELEQKSAGKTIWVCGGADILVQCQGLFDRVYLTYLAGSHRVDVKLDVNKFLLGYTPVQAQTQPGSSCCMVIYKNAFKRI